MNIVSNGKTITRLGSTGSSIENALEVVLSHVDIAELVVVIGIEI